MVISLSGASRAQRERFPVWIVIEKLVIYTWQPCGDRNDNHFFWRLGEGELMCSGFGEGHSAENVEKAMFSIEKHELEARGAALDATSTPY